MTLNKKRKKSFIEIFKTNKRNKTYSHKKISCPLKKNRKSNKIFSLKNIVNKKINNDNPYDKLDSKNKLLINNSKIKNIKKNIKINETRKNK